MVKGFHFTSQHFGRLDVSSPYRISRCNIVLAQAQASEKTSPFATELGKEFASETATVNGITDRQEATSYFVRIAQHNEA